MVWKKAGSVLGLYTYRNKTTYYATSASVVMSLTSGAAGTKI